MIEAAHSDNKPSQMLGNLQKVPMGFPECHCDDPQVQTAA